MKDKMLILTNRPLHNGPRMIREFNTFQEHFDMVAIGRTKPLDAGIGYENIDKFVSFFDYKLVQVFRVLFYYGILNTIYEKYARLEKYIIDNHFKVIIIHDPSFLPLISKLKKKTSIKAIYNAHEYHPLEFEEKENWLKTIGRYHYKIYAENLHNLDMLVNVCEGIANKCKDEFGIDSLVVPNVALQSDVMPVKNEGTIRLIYHGAIMKSRNIEDMIDLAQILGDQYSLDIMGVESRGNEEYFQSLRQYAAAAGNVHFIDAVPFDQIISTINKYDIGLFLLRPNNFNYTHALPNKLYEFIQAKLAIAISPSVEMKRVVEQYDLGVVGDDFSPKNLADKIASLTRADIMRYKNNSVSTSKIENAAHYSAIYLERVNELIDLS